MGVIPVRPEAHSSCGADDCRLCAEISAPGPVRTSAVRVRQLLPPASIVTVGLILAAVDGGALAWVGGGVAAGVIAGALYLWAGRRQREHQMDQLMRQISQLRMRLAEVATAASAESPQVARAKASSEAVRFTFGLHLDGPRARLELQTAANSDSPTRLRVKDQDGQIVAISGMAILSVDGNLEFQLEPPLDLIADLDAGQEISYAIEALVDDEWKPVRLRDTGRRTTNTVDRQGRLSRVPAMRDVSLLSDPAPPRRSTLN